MLNVLVEHDMENTSVLYEHLHSIKEIYFTNREIDVIACVLHGRVIKKIAIILAISYKTVGTHISNIMLKIGCRSQEGIIDFIEGSNKYNLLRQHYVKLLINSGFRQELANVYNLAGEQNDACLIVADDLQNEYKWLFDEFCEYLKLTGIITTLVKAADIKSYNHTGYVLHCCLSVDSVLPSIEISNIDLSHVIVVSFGPQAVKSISASLNAVTKINLHDHDNQYFFVFAVIQQLLPQVDIEQNIAAFKKLYAVHSNSSSELFAKKAKHSLNSHDMTDVSPITDGFTCRIKRYLNLTSKKIWLFGGFLMVAIVCAGFFFGYHIDGHKNISMAGNKLTSAKSSALHWNIPRQDHNFIGRKELLKELQARLHPKTWYIAGANRLSAITVCAGLGGVGKTQLALQYVHNTKQNYSLKAWFFAENIDQLKQQYVDLAGELGYSAAEPTFAKAQIYVKDWLSKHPGWLLVYDNVDSYNEIKEFLPNDGGSIILTSRQQKWPNSFEKLDVDVMTESEAMQLIESLLQRKITVSEKKSLHELVIELGRLPLALAQAGAYIKQNAITITEYIDLYKKYEQELLMDSTLPEGIYSLPIAATWNISLETIVRDARDSDRPPLALHLLSACAYLAPEKISEHLLLAWFKAEYPELPNVELLFAKLIAQLRQYSMISKDDNGNVTIHRLVQAVVRYQHNKSSENKPYYASLTSQWFNTLFNSVHTEFIKKTRVIEDETRKKNLLPHMQSLLGYYKRLWPNNASIELFNTLNDLGDGFLLIGDSRSARSYYEDALTTLGKKYDRENIKASHTLDSLGNAYRQLGDLKQAQISHERAIAIKEKHYGTDHIEIATTLDQLGRDFRVLGDAKQAIKIHERSLTIKQKYYKKDNIEIALTLDQLGRDYGMLRNFKHAKELHERCLLIKEAYYGEDHSQLATTLDYLGRDYVAMGEFAKAKELLERAAAIKEKYYNKNHIEVAITNDHLARANRGLGYMAQAIKLHEASVKVKENHYGSDHIEVANTIERLGREYRDIGKCREAKQIHEKVLAVKKTHWGEGHTEVAFTLDQLSRDCACLKDSKQAKIYSEKATDIRKNSNFYVSLDGWYDFNMWGEN